MITALAMVLAMMPAMALADDGGAAAIPVSFADCTLIGEDEDVEAPFYYIEVESGATNIELTDLDGKMEEAGVIAAVHSAPFYVENTNVVDITAGFSIQYTDFEDAYGEYLDQDAIAGLDFSNIYAMFIMDDDDDYRYLVIQSDMPPKTYGFTASLNGTEIADITKAEGAYSYTNWVGVTKNVDLYTVTVPVDTESVDIAVENPVLAYNYGANPCTDDDYLAGATPDYMTGNTEFSPKIDSNADGVIDFVQFQTPYDSAYNSDLLYAVTFKYSDESVAAKAAGEITALLDSGSEEDVAAAREKYEALTDAQKALVDSSVVEALEDAEAAVEADKAVQDIEALLKKGDAASVAAAREKYEALSDKAKAKVDESVTEAIEIAEAAVEAAKMEAVDAKNAAAQVIRTTSVSAAANTKASVDAYNDAVKALKALINDDEATAKDVKVGLLALNKAFLNLEPKSANTLTVKAKTVTLKKKALKKKKATVKAAKAMTVAKPVGTVTYKKVAGSNKVSVAKNGKLTVKKKTKKGTYSVKIRVSASGSDTVLAASKVVTVKIKVK